MWKPQKTMSNIAVLTWERWINPESCTPEWEITLANLKEKQCRGNTLLEKANSYIKLDLEQRTIFRQENHISPYFTTIIFNVLTPPGDAGGLSREYVLRIPIVS